MTIRANSNRLKNTLQKGFVDKKENDSIKNVKDIFMFTIHLPRLWIMTGLSILLLGSKVGAAEFPDTQEQLPTTTHRSLEVQYTSLLSSIRIFSVIGNFTLAQANVDKLEQIFGLEGLQRLCTDLAEDAQTFQNVNTFRQYIQQNRLQTIAAVQQKLGALSLTPKPMTARPGNLLQQLQLPIAQYVTPIQQQIPVPLTVALPIPPPSCITVPRQHASRHDDALYTRELFEDIKLLFHNNLPAADLVRRIHECLEVLPQEELPIQAMVIQPNSRVFVIGDIHCSYNELLAQIQRMRELICFTSTDSLRLLQNTYLVFTGDFIDRGMQGTEVITFVMGLKTLNPTNVFICRGNHEIENIASNFGFFGNKEVVAMAPTPDIKLHFSDKTDFFQIKQNFTRLFSKLPLAVFLGIRNPRTNMINLGIYNHAGIDKQADSQIVALLNRTIEAPLDNLITITSGLGTLTILTPVN